MISLLLSSDDDPYNKHLDGMNWGGYTMFVTVALYLMLCSLPVIDSSEDVGPYFLSKDDGPWNITGSNCTLATPPFSTNDAGKFILVDSELLAVLENEEDEIWVGYFKAYQNFQYIGCVNLKEIPRNNTVFHTAHDPGLCYSVCQTQYVGIIKRAIRDAPNCFCIASKNMTILEKHCDRKCAKDILCGGQQSGEIYVSLYEMETSVNVTESSGQCCFKEPVSNRLEWDACENYFKAVCKTAENELETIEGSHSWKESMQACFERGLDLLPASETQINVARNPQVWTAMVRRQAIFNISKKNKEPITFGYIEQVKNEFQLKFDRNPERKSLCVKDQRYTPTTTKASSYLETEHTTISQSVSDGTSTVTNEPSATVSGPGEYVGVSVGVLLGLGILAAVVVILWRKRSKNTHQGEPQYANQVENAGYESDHPVSIKLQNENERPPNEIYESNYDEIENEAHRAGPISDEYDTTNAVRMNAHLDKTDNVYNRLGALEEMYNHVGPPVTVDQASMYGYNCGEGPVRDTDDVNNEYFTLEPTLIAGQPGEPKSETYGNVLPEQDNDDVNHEYFTLEPGYGAGQHGEPKSETYGNMWPANDQNKGVFPDEDDTYNHI